MVVGSGDDPDSSVYLKGVEMSSSGGFWMKLRLFSTFWQFPIESDNSGRVLKAVTTAVGAGDSVGGFDSKMAHKCMLFWSLVTGTRRCGELAIMGVQQDGKGRCWGSEGSYVLAIHHLSAQKCWDKWLLGTFGRKMVNFRFLGDLS